MLSLRDQRRQRVKARVRKKIFGSSHRPRLSVFRSNRQIYVQLIDDSSGTTLTSMSSCDLSESIRGTGKTEISRKTGIEAAKKVLSLGIKEIVFDRGGYLYHGRVKALAEGAREGGLKF